MSEDETQIRGLVQRWHAATKAGDIEAVLALMTDDVVFLTPGREPMSKSEFAALSAGPPGAPRPQFDARQELHEVEVSGPLAFMRSSLAVLVTPPGATAPIERAGQTLTVFRKIGGYWLLARDANLLAPKPPSSVAASEA
jgi:uncharacterized protein (TIGR02246 family)